MVRGLAAPLHRLVRREDRGEVESVVHHIADEQGEMALREPLLQGRGQQEQLVGCIGLEGLHAGTIPHTAARADTDSAC